MYASEATFEYIAYGMITWGIFVFIALLFNEAEYGRYTKPTSYVINAKLAWFIQELPSLVVPLLLIYYTDCPRISHLCNLILVFCFILHYVQRTLIYPLTLKGKPLPLFMVVLAFLFCSVNGYLQCGFLLYIAKFKDDWLYHPQFLTGLVMFLSGMVINIHSDYILRNLRKPGETGYKIPTGGIFDYVSGANFFGEILEWCGFAVASNSLPALAFAISTCCNIGPRSVHHHRWYKRKFEDYPKKRKAIIPFVF